MEYLCPLSAQAKSSPDQPALIYKERAWTYRELNSCVLATRDRLKNAGIKKGQRVAFIADCHPSTLILLFAIFSLEAIACPLSTRLPAQQVVKSLDYLKTSPLFGSQNLLPR